MARFEFSKNTIELDIAGVKVSIPNADAFKERIAATAERMQNSKAQTFSAQRDVLLDVLDELLGEDTMDAVLEARGDLSLANCMELYVYVAEEAMKREYEAVAKCANIWKTAAERLNAVQPHGAGAEVPAVSPHTPAIPMAQTAAARRAAQRAERRKQ